MITKERIKQIRDFHEKGDDEARRDSGKRRWHLLPMELMEGVVDVFQKAIEKGEMYDKETGLLHYDHISSNLAILKYHFLEKGGKDV